MKPTLALLGIGLLSVLPALAMPLLNVRTATHETKLLFKEEVIGPKAQTLQDDFRFLHENAETKENAFFRTIR